MIRNLKVLGLALVAVLALNAVAVSSASATEFESAAGTTSAKGSQSENGKFKTKNGTIECTSGTFRGMPPEGKFTVIQTSDSTATNGPEKEKKGIEYGGCKFLGFINVAVNTTGCQYEFKASGKVSVICSAGNTINFEAGNCRTKVGGGAANENLNSVTYANGSGEVTVTPNVKSITYTAEKVKEGGGNCPTFEGTAADGEYTKGKTPVGGTNSTNEGMETRELKFIP